MFAKDLTRRPPIVLRAQTPVREAWMLAIGAGAELCGEFGTVADVMTSPATALDGAVGLDDEGPTGDPHLDGVSAATVWELTIKAMLGRLSVPEKCASRLAEQGLSLLSITADRCCWVSGVTSSSMPRCSAGCRIPYVTCCLR